MTQVTLHDLTVPVFLRAFRNLSAILDKGRDFADAQGLDHAVLLEARLIEDMAPLTAQIQRASDTAKMALVRMGGVENVPFPDEEKTFADLQARIAKTVAFLEAVPAGAIEAKGEAPILMKVGGGEVSFAPQDYALQFALPNFFFHETTAYALLRKAGVQVGKRDFLGAY